MSDDEETVCIIDVSPCLLVVLLPIEFEVLDLFLNLLGGVSTKSEIWKRNVSSTMTRLKHETSTTR